MRMPWLKPKRMEMLSREDVKTVLSVCGTRDRALVLTLIDSGIRRKKWMVSGLQSIASRLRMKSSEATNNVLIFAPSAGSRFK